MRDKYKVASIEYLVLHSLRRNTYSNERVKVSILALSNDGQFSIKASEVIVTLSVYDLNGRQVLEVKGTNSKSQAIDLMLFPKGMYIINVCTSHSIFKELVLIE